MSRSILDLAYQLTQTGEPFVLATVVWCLRPTSAKPGAQAIIQSNGQLTGWIGGSCAQPVVQREAMRILHEGSEPYLLRLGASETELPRDNMRVFPMSCASNGILDIYMEPHFPPPQLILIGESPVITALRSLAPVIDFSIQQQATPDLSNMNIHTQTCILIATHGQFDEDALEQALRSPARYVGMVSSHKRADDCRAYLLTAGLTDRQIARLRAPAGLDLGAVTPEEIAASILAELVQFRRHRLPTEESGEQPAAKNLSEEASTATVRAIDPVCGMEVEIATARHYTTFDGRSFYFCCPACKRLFERNPQEYLIHTEQ